MQLAHSIPAEIFARAGFDWLIIDMEHAPGDQATLLGQLQAMNGTGTVPFVRVPWNDEVAIKKVLDLGAQGVLIPYVNTGDEARAAVAACKYPPQGVRGVAGSTRAAGYGADTKAYLSRANREIVVVVAVETREAVDNLDDILQVDNLDGVFIGPMDLATNLGHLGNPAHPEVQEIIGGIEAKVLASDKFLGTLTPSWDKAVSCFERGYQFLILMQDGTALMAAANGMAATFRESFGEG